MMVKGVNIGQNVLSITKHMRAYVNAQRHECAQCSVVPDTLFQFWSEFPGEDALSERVVRALPEFCGHKCWQKFVDGGNLFSDRAELERKRVRYAAAKVAEGEAADKEVAT